MDLIAVLAHAGESHASGAGAAALAAIAIAAMVVPLAVLAVVGRAFWRAGKRDAASAPAPRSREPD